MSDSHSNHSYTAKAERHLRWAALADESMKRAGEVVDLDAAQHHLFNLLTHVNVAFEALADASRRLDNGQSVGRMLRDRTDDPLLYYFWKARVADTHLLLNWDLSFANIEFEILNAKRANRFLPPDLSQQEMAHFAACRLYQVATFASVLQLMQQGHRPSAGDEQRVGIRLLVSRRGIGLNDFTYVDKNGKTISVAAPTKHLGVVLPNSADIAAQRVISYYRGILDDLAPRELR